MPDVHSSHCCAVHGCKYSDPDCTVVLGIEKQEYRQECCDDADMILLEAYTTVIEDMKKAHDPGEMIEKLKDRCEVIDKRIPAYRKNSEYY